MDWSTQSYSSVTAAKITQLEVLLLQHYYYNPLYIEWNRTFLTNTIYAVIAALFSEGVLFQNFAYRTKLFKRKKKKVIRKYS